MDGAGRPLLLTTHNAFWLQGCPFEGTSPGGASAPVLAGLAETYRRLAPDCLCLQEVQSEETAERLAEALGMRARWCPGGALPQYGLAVLTRGPVEAEDWRGSGLVPERGWLMVRVGGMLVANVHLPSGRQGGPELAAGQRLAEIRAVAERSPDVIAGDHNERPGGAVSLFLAESGYADAALVAGAGRLPTARSDDPPKRIDYVWVRKELAPGLAYQVIRQEAFGLPGGRDGALLSDHFPVTVRLTSAGRELP